jgi:uncharacterized protein with NRDE domain
MCTVSFVNANGKMIITSNRDEKIIRPNAIEPKNYLINNKKILFPKDKKAGGTWYAADEHSNVIVLLNGASEKHIVKDSYRKSRGLILLELISSLSPIELWQEIDLNDIEPFTIVLYENKKLYQLRWNQIDKETITLDVAKSYIWSSATLYSEEIRLQREKWFYTFLDTKPEVNEEELFNFHRYTEEENNEHGLVINRNDLLKTLSITQTIIEKNKLEMKYFDLLNKNEYNNTFFVI